MKARERLATYGASAMTDAELLSVAVGLPIEQARKVLEDTDLRRLRLLGTPGLEKTRGIGPARAAAMAAVLELAERLTREPVSSDGVVSYRMSIHGAGDAFVVLRPLIGGRQTQEQFVVLALDARHRLLAVRQVALGSATQVEVHPREVFAVAVENRAVAIICGHPHPSGDCTVSGEDIVLTKRLKEAGTLLGIPLLDHLIVAGDAYVSLAEQGLL